MKGKLHFSLVMLIAILYALFINYYVLNFYIEFNTSDLGNYLRNTEAHFGRFSKGDYHSSKMSIFYHLLYLIDLSHSYISNKEFSALIFSILASSILFVYTLLSGVQNLKHLLIVLPIVVMLLLTPKVIDLFAATIRNGAAFAVFYYSIQLLEGYKKNIGILFSVLIHMSMLPLLALYIFYYFVHKVINVKSTFVILLVLFFFCLALMYGLSIVYPAGINSFLIGYKAMVFFLRPVFIFFSFYSSALKSVEGFMAIGIMFIILLSFIFNYNLIRYLGVSIIFFSTFIISIKRKSVTQLYSIAYFPFVLTYLYYWIK